MPYTLTDKLVVAIASSALFDLTESDRVFGEEGRDAYRHYQRERENSVLEPGVAFPFIQRLLSLNDGGEKFVEVVLLSRNDPDTGLRVMNSIEAHGLDITRGAFLNGRSPHRYIPRFGAKLFLTANESDVRKAIKRGHPAGIVLPSQYADDPDDDELRIAFDFDGVLIDDEAEQVFKQSGLDDFHASETEKALTPHSPGLMKDLLQCIAEIQRREVQQAAAIPAFRSRIRVAIVTARNAPSHKRMVTTLRHWGINVDETFFLGGVEKTGILQEFAPHIFFDDQRLHLDATSGLVPSVHIPFGEANDVDESTLHRARRKK